MQPAANQPHSDLSLNQRPFRPLRKRFIAWQIFYCALTGLFIAQSYGMHLPLATQLSMLLVLMLTSKGIAGVPRASLVVIAGTLATFNIPEAGLALLLGIDPLLDMGRSATNVVGNSVATAVVSKWENSLEESAPNL